MDFYEIFSGTPGLVSCSWVWCKLSLEHKYVSLQNLLPYNHNEACYTLNYFCTVHFIFSLDYHVNALNSEWIHVTFQGEEFCDGWRLMGGRIRCQSHDKKYPWDFGLQKFGVEFNKLHVWPCINHVECFTKVMLMESYDKDVKNPGLRCYYVWQDSFYCFLLVLM